MRLALSRVRRRKHGLDEPSVDRSIADAVRGSDTEALAAVAAADLQFVLHRIAYHGVAGMLAERCSDEPATPLGQAIVDSARATALWELRHRQRLIAVLDEMATAGVEARLLKGSALAYSLYPNPAWRERGDSDLLVRPGQREAARAVLAAAGFSPADSDGIAEDLRHQEVWSSRPEEGGVHIIDLHFRPFNTAALDGPDWLDRMFREPQPLPLLGANAFAPARPVLLVHACLHRLMHLCAPYFVDGRAEYGADRLVWLVDVDLLAKALSGQEWRAFVELALEQRQARACREGLLAARDGLGTAVPAEVLDALGGQVALSSHYLHSGRLRRSWEDLRAAGVGRAQARFAIGRMFPGAPFMRSKYPEMARAPLALLHARRFAELLFRRRAAR